MSETSHPPSGPSERAPEPTTTAREKFQLGDPVRFSAQGQTTFPKRGAIEGVVSGFGRTADLVRVRIPGTVHISSYHMDFWDVIRVGYLTEPTQGRALPAPPHAEKSTKERTKV